jgi:hypothetical protein
MRIVDTIPHPTMTISIFQMNDKYQVKFEAGPMEQTFKFRVDDVGNLENLKTKLTENFITQTKTRFDEMYTSFKTIF